MDLRDALLDVLDNPSVVWHSIVTNLPEHAKTALLVLTTCSTPVDIVEWQSSVARVSVSAAAQFEAALRLLDDSFVATSRNVKSEHVVIFRNPSIDDFCAAHLDSNAGFSVTVASMSPSIGQIERLMQLGSARDTRGSNELRYPNLHAALIANPSLLLDRLLQLLPDDALPTAAFTRASSDLINLIGYGDLRRIPRLQEVRAHLVPRLMKLCWNNNAFTLYGLLDNRRVAQTLHAVLGQRFDEFYGDLAGSAFELNHFDSLVNLDVAVGRRGAHAAWADRFNELTERWLLDEFDESSVFLNRSIYEKVAEHLDLDEASRLDEWEEAVREAEAREVEPDDDDSWRSESVENAAAEDAGQFDALDQERATIDAMFEGLIHDDTAVGESASHFF